MINQIIETAFSGFWAFMGMMILLNGTAFFIVNGMIKIWNSFMRMLMVRKHGWPPSHLDADGNRKVEDEDEVN